MAPLTGMNATFATRHRAARLGGVHQPERRALHRGPGLESQGNGGFSAFVSIGSMVDVGWAT